MLVYGISKFARVHVAIPTRRKFDKFLVRHGVSPATQISYTYEYRMRQSKTKLTCASPKKKKRCFSPKRETITAGLVLCLIKNVLDQRVYSHLHSLVRTFCQHFTENPLFIFNKILAIIMYIPPTFPFFFYDKNWLFSYVFLLSFLL